MDTVRIAHAQQINVADRVTFTDEHQTVAGHAYMRSTNRQFSATTESEHDPSAR